MTLIVVGEVEFACKTLVTNSANMGRFYTLRRHIIKRLRQVTRLGVERSGMSVHL